MPADIEVTVESFGEEHPEMNPMLLVEDARVALAKYHQSPGRFRTANRRTTRMDSWR